MLLLCAAAPDPVAPPPPPPALTLAARATLDSWDVASGGIARGTVLLDKVQASGTLNGAAIGFAGFRAHVQVLRIGGKSLSDRVGDIQTVSNIEAIGATRLFEAWVEQAVGTPGHGGSIRAGLIDLNSEFDAIDPSSVFLNASHGIGPDLSASGRNGPSNYPVTSSRCAANGRRRRC